MRKLLIWDGDQTLWNGIVANGDIITLPKGRQELCQTLSERGVLQAVASHNLKQDVDELLHRFSLSNYFLHNQTEFGKSKSEMVRQIMKDYGLAIPVDVVYLDDDPFNLADVQTISPHIAASVPTQLDNTIQLYFSKGIYTEEDRLRVRRYQSEEQRKQAGNAYDGDYQEFLKSCGLVLSLSDATESDLPRIVDLFARANRMAALAHPYSESQIVERLAAMTVGRVEDKFGDYGMSAIIHHYMDDWLPDHPVHIEGLVISCRLQGRGIGSAMLGTILNHYPINNTIHAHWNSTEYNHGIQALYEWYNFNISKNALCHRFENDHQHLVATKTLTERVELPPWIQVICK